MRNKLNVMNTKPTPRLSPRILSVLVIGALPLVSPVASAQLYWQGSTTGIGGGANNAINTNSLNWNPQADGSGTKQAFTPNSDVVFAGTGGAVSLSNDIAMAFGDFKVNSTGYVFGVANGDKVLTLSSFSGSALSSAVFQNNNTKAAKLTITNTGNTTFSGTIQDGGAYALSIVKSGSGTLTLNGTNTFTGSLSLSAGTLVLATDSFSSSCTLLLGNTTTLATAGSARTWSGKFGGAASGANATISGDQNLTFDSLNASTGSSFGSGGSTAITVNLSNGATATFGGTSIGIAPEAGLKTFSLTGSGKVVISAAIVNGGASNTNSLEIRNTGGVTLSGSNTFTGDLTIRSGGVLNVASLNNIGTDGVLGKSANPIYTISDGAYTATVNWTGASATSTDRGIDLGAATTTGTGGNLYLNAEGVGKMTLGGSITGRGNSGSALTRTINLGGSGAGGAEISGNVSGNNAGSGTMTISVNKSGGSTWTLSGSNSYIGTTAVSGGSLLLNGQHVDDSTTTTSVNGYGNATNGHFLVQDGATIGGIGRIAGRTTANNSNLLLAQSNATVAPGSGGIGTFTLDGGNISGTNSRVLNMAAGSKFLFDLGPGGTSDKISLWNYVSGDVALNNNTIDLNLTGTQIDGRYTVSLFGFYSDSGTNAASSGITSGLTIGTKGAIIGTPTLNYNSGGSTIDLTYNVGAMFYTNGTTCTVSAAENYDAATYIRNGTTVNASVSGALPSTTPTTLVMDDSGSGSSTLALGASQTVASVSGAGTSTIALGANNLTVSGTGSTTFSGTISGTGGSLTKSGGGTLTLSGASANTYSGTTTVSGGVLALNKSSGEAVTGNLTVGSGATDSSVKLLLSASNQVGSTGGQTVTLSGGTIQRASGVSEVFGNLNITADSFLDFGTGTAGNLQFGTYTPSSLITVQNFFAGNTLKFATQLTTEQLNTKFSFDSGFTTNWNGSTFTITAIPEPSAILAAIALAGFMIWPARRRLSASPSSAFHRSTCAGARQSRRCAATRRVKATAPRTRSRRPCSSVARRRLCGPDTAP